MGNTGILCAVMLDTKVTMILPLCGKIYSEKVSETCVGFWKANGTYTDEDAKTIDKFLEVFKDQNFAPGSSILLTVSPAGSLTTRDMQLQSPDTEASKETRVCRTRRVASRYLAETSVGRWAALTRVEVNKSLSRSPHSVHIAQAGESERVLRDAFSKAFSPIKLGKPYVIFIDAICPRRDSRYVVILYTFCTIDDTH